MRIPIPSNNLQFALNLHFQSVIPVKLRVITFDRDKPFTKYSDRSIQVNGDRTIYLTFPNSPKFMILQIEEVGAGGVQTNNWKLIGYNAAGGRLLPYQLIKIRKCDVWMDEETRAFVTFAELFAKNAGFLVNGMYKDDSGKFTIDFQDFIVDKESGMMVNTPARIGHKSGIIHVARQIFQDFTVPQRFMILMHEFSHKYINPKFGKGIGNEFAADINALYVYLGLGYPPIDARTVYLKVFNQDGVDPQLSLKRYKYINNFINGFKDNKMASCNTNYKAA
jgi:hypothetical protein